MAVIALLGIIVVPGSFHQIDAGEVAVVKVWGNAKEVRGAGIHFDFWISHRYEIYDAKVQQTTVTTQAYSNDGQTMDIEIVIQYQIQQAKAVEIAKTYGGLQMLESKIETVAIERAKSVLSQKSAMNIIETRSDVSRDVTEVITTAVNDSYYANITTVVLTDISFTDAFEKTVEDKMIAEQEKLKAQYEKEKAIIQAEQALEVSKREAEAKLALAQGDANAQKALADAEAYSTQIKIVELARSMGYKVKQEAIYESQIKTDEKGNPIYTDETKKEYKYEDVKVGTQYEIVWDDASEADKKVLLQYLQYLEYLNKWNGELPEVITGDSASIFIPVSSSTQG